VTGQEFVDGATVTPRGTDWGQPLWTFYNPAAQISIDVQADNEPGAVTAAAAAAEILLALLAQPS